jgi:predicted dehydrogenase
MVTTAVMVGAGQRGYFSYGAFAEAYPEDLRFVAVVDPDPTRRDRFTRAHRSATQFPRIGDWLAAGRLADIAIVASPDRDHHEAGVGALRAGYDVLLEKPMAASLAAAVDLARVAAETRRTVAVAHVLRYTGFFTTLHDLVTSGRIGDVVTVTHRENVSAFHMAHSFVRGNWARAEESTPMIVQKCTHDFDILNWNLPSPVARLSSIGSLLHFLPEKAPPGATARCTAPCPVTDCPYDARRYLNPAWTGWPVHVLTDDLSESGRRAALDHGPWGRCVYTAGSDVVDQQVVTMELESGASVVLVMHGHSADESRTMRYDGTLATVRARFGRDSAIELTDHAGGATESIPVATASGGHGGGDSGVMFGFLDALRRGTRPQTGVADSLESHVLAYAAEEARVSGKTIDVAAYRRVALAPLG